MRADPHQLLLPGRIGAACSRAARAWRTIFGVPDYDVYLEHMRNEHAGEQPLARGEFLAWALERRHRGSGPRCC